MRRFAASAAVTDARERAIRQEVAAEVEAKATGLGIAPRTAAALRESLKKQPDA